MDLQGGVSSGGLDKMASDVLTGHTEDRSVSSSQREVQYKKRLADLPETEVLPSLENDFIRAKSYLLRQCTASGDNLYDHLSDVLHKILTERPTDIADNFEEYCRNVRRYRFRQNTNQGLEFYLPSPEFKCARKLMKLLETCAQTTPKDDWKCEQDLIQIQTMLEMVGVGVAKSEILFIAVSLRKLTSKEYIRNVRFWGKVMGLQKNYIIIEAELIEEENERRNMIRDELMEQRRQARYEEAEEKKQEELRVRAEVLENLFNREIEFAEERTNAVRAKIMETIVDVSESTVFNFPEPCKPWPVIQPMSAVLPKNKPECPTELCGVGVNRCTYFVCNEPGDEWIELPDVTPQQITSARFINYYFTGVLDSEIETYPVFPGVELNYLRAQIARISANTHISPLGFYNLKEEEEGRSLEQNPNFQMLSTQDLADTSLEYWVHHTEHILKHGSTLNWDPNLADDEEDLPKVEQPVELLVPLSKEDTRWWSIRNTSSLLPKSSFVYLRSNLWPGAYSFATDTECVNIYVGYGYKFTSEKYILVPFGEISKECPVNFDIMEAADPTVDDERKWDLREDSEERIDIND